MQTTLGRLDTRQPEDIETGSTKLSTFNDALREVAGLGVPLPGRPTSGFRGEMPDEITSLNDEQLGNLLNNLSQWEGFIEFELAKAAAARDEAAARLDFVRSRIRISVRTDGDGKKLAVKDKDDLVDTDPRVVDALSRSLYTQTIWSLTRVLREKSQRDWETVSRRITQRGQAIERMKRGDNVAGYTAPTVPTFNRPRQAR